MDRKISSLQKQIQRLKYSFAKDSMKSMFSEVSKRDALAKRLFPILGNFDHSSKTTQEIAQYAVKKLGLNCAKGHEKSVISGYLSARAPQARSNSVGMDSAKNSKRNESLINFFGE